MDRDVLPKTFKPVNYDISLYDLELGGKYSYQGTVKIQGHIAEANCKEIILNANQIKLNSASLAGQKSTDVKYDEKAQRATIAFSDGFQPAEDAVLEIQFSGTMNNDMAGFYRSKYKPAVTPSPAVPTDGQYHYMFSTQFESCAARMAFPCFDEPNLKATFDVELEIPEELTALSNMPEKGTRPTKNGRKMVSFERSPIMSSYLLAWAFGDFEYVEDFTRRKYNGKNLPVRVYTTRGLKEKGRFALEHAHQITDLFSDVFQIEYPLPKVDLLAVHEFSHGAMENWGLITYRTTAVLYDEKTSDANFKIRVSYVVAHELAHQWFGNLVTMDWWSELWLNEGFATWVGFYAIDHIHPEWQVWSQFITDSTQKAMALDGLRASHPIEVPLRDALGVEQVFDAISYLKGSSTIRMLANHLGNETFLNGVADYLKAHAYGNATTDDLWRALKKASGQDVKSFMDVWIRTIGFPVVTITEEPGQINIQQRRYLSTGDVKSEEDKTLWWVPLGLKTAGAGAKQATTALAVREDTIRDIDESFYKLNADSTGFYRTNYPPDRLVKLGAARDKLSGPDCIGLVADAAALAVSGEATSAGLLSLLAEFQQEQDPQVWTQILLSLANVRSTFGTNEAVSTGLKKFTLKLVASAVEKVGWDFAPNENLLAGKLRAMLIGTAGGAGHQPTTAKANEVFAAYISGNKDALHPSLRLPVFRLAIENGGESAFEAIKNEYMTTTTIDGREICLVAMGRVQTPELARKFLDFQMTEDVAIQDFHSGAGALSMNVKTREELWRYMKTNWKTVYGKMSGNSVVVARYLKVALGNFSDMETEKDIADFFKDKDTAGYDRGLVEIADTIRTNASYRQRDEKVILEWLEAKGFA